MLSLKDKTIAARAILGWNQQELAEAADVSENTIKNIEAEKDVGAKTETKVLRALSRAGIEVTDDAIRKPDATVTKFEGDGWFVDLLEDAFHTLKGARRKEMLIKGGDNRVSSAEVVEGFRKLIAAGVHIREMVEEGNTHLMGKEEDYRWIPSAHYKNNITVTYGNKTLIDLGTFGYLLTNQQWAEVARKDFDLLWSLLPPLNVKSTSDVRY